MTTTENQCWAPECGLSPRSLGLCHKHHQRFKKRGTVELPPRPTLVQRFWSRVAKTGSCWEWKGCKNNDGYGFINLGVHSKSAPAHRVAYQLLVGPIPEGLQIDHLCENTGCVNPAHLEAVTLAENNRRAMASRGWKRKRQIP